MNNINDERIILELQYLVFDYYLKGKMFDEAFIRKAVEIVVNHLSLDDFCHDVKVDKTVKGLSHYNFVKRKIYVNLDALMNCFINGLNSLKDKYISPVLFLYNGILNAILHELDHVCKFKNLSEGFNTLETKLVGYTNPKVLLKLKPNFLRDKYPNMSKEEEELVQSVVIKHDSSVYKKFQVLNPIESLAITNSTTATDNVFKGLGINETYPYSRYNLVGLRLRAYLVSLNPARFYLEKLGESDVWYDLEPKFADLSLETRMSLNGPITEEEFQALNKEHNYLSRRLIK